MSLEAIAGKPNILYRVPGESRGPWPPHVARSWIPAFAGKAVK
jgi:hypothetical protein